MAPPAAALEALAEKLEAAARQTAAAAEDALTAERTAHAVTWGQLRSSDDNLLALQAGALQAILRIATPPDARLALNTILVAYGAAFAAAFPRPARAPAPAPAQEKRPKTARAPAHSPAPRAREPQHPPRELHTCLLSVSTTPRTPSL